MRCNVLRTIQRPSELDRQRFRADVAGALIARRFRSNAPKVEVTSLRDVRERTHDGRQLLDAHSSGVMHRGSAVPRLLLTWFEDDGHIAIHAAVSGTQVVAGPIVFDRVLSVCIVFGRSHRNVHHAVLDAVQLAELDAALCALLPPRPSKVVEPLLCSFATATGWDSRVYDRVALPDAVVRVYAAIGCEPPPRWIAETCRSKPFAAFAGDIEALAVSPDRSLVCAMTHEHGRVWTRDGQRIVDVGGGDGAAFSPSGKRLLTWHLGEVVVTELAGVPVSRVLVRHTWWRFLAACFVDEETALISVDGTLTGMPLAAPSLPDPPQDAPSIGLVLIHREQLLYADGVIAHLVGGRAVMFPSGRTIERSGPCALSPDGALLASAQKPDEIDIIEIATGARRSLSAHLDDAMDTASGIAFSPSARTLAVAGSNGVIVIWGVDTGEPLRVIEPSTGFPHHVAFLSESTLLWAGSDGLRLTRFTAPRSPHTVSP